MDAGSETATTSEFQLVYQQGVRVAGRCLVIFGLCRPGGRCRLGITATRKIGPAVVRNRARRRVRGWSAATSPVVNGKATWLVNVRRACAEAPWQEASNRTSPSAWPRSSAELPPAHRPRHPEDLQAVDLPSPAASMPLHANLLGVHGRGHCPARSSAAGCGLGCVGLAGVTLSPRRLRSSAATERT